MERPLPDGGQDAFRKPKCLPTMLAENAGSSEHRAKWPQTETLRTLELAFTPYQVSNEQLIRMVVEEIEKDPERMPEEFSVFAREVMMAAWSCKK
jgi:hypothetical protein